MSTDPKDLSQHPLALAAAATREWKNPLVHLHHAARAGWLDDIEAELEAGEDIDVRTGDDWTWTPLHIASMSEHVSVVRLLLDRGADINALDGRGNTALMLAIHAKRIETAYLLLDAGADTRVTNRSGRTADNLATHDPELQSAVRRAGLKQIAGNAGATDREKPIF